MLEMLLGNTVIAAALAVVVLALCRCCRLNPAARHALWLVVLVKLLSPVGLLWPLPLPFALPHVLAAPTHPEAVAPDSPESQRDNTVPKLSPAGEEWVDLAAVLVDPADVALTGATVEAADPNKGKEAVPVAGAEAAAPGIRQSSAATPTAALEGNDLPLALWLPILWLAGAVVVAVRYGRRTLHFSRYARSGKPAAPSLQRQVAELAALLRVRPPVARLLADLPSPVVWCLFRPVLLWPKGLEDQLRAGGRRAVLVHELAHLRRRDHWVRWLELAAAILYWWNPLFWLVRRQLRFHAELACDAWVTGTLPDSRRDYAEALLEVCARSSRAAAPSPAVGVGGDGRRDFRRRLTMIMRDPMPCRLAVGAKLSVVLLLLAALPAWTLGQGPTTPRPEPQIEIQTSQPKERQPEGVKNFDFDVRFHVVGNDEDTARKAREIEGKIADLQKQLQALKATRAAAEQKKKTETRFWEFRGAGQEGKVIERKDVPKLEWKILGSQDAPKDRAKVNWDWVTPSQIELKQLQRQYKVIGPDGKEIKDAKVIVIEPVAGTRRPIPVKVETIYKTQTPEPSEASRKQLEEARRQLEKLLTVTRVQQAKTATVRGVLEKSPAVPAGKVIHLSRVTYTLSKDKAAALAAFLQANVKAPVLELKVEERGLTVTTTPETQAAIGGIANLMGQGSATAIFSIRELRIAPELERK